MSNDGGRDPRRAGADEGARDALGAGGRRKADDYPTVERAIRVAIAKHQAAFEREYYRSLRPEAQAEYRSITATLMLYDLEK